MCINLPCKFPIIAKKLLFYTPILRSVTEFGHDHPRDAGSCAIDPGNPKVHLCMSVVLHHNQNSIPIQIRIRNKGRQTGSWKYKISIFNFQVQMIFMIFLPKKQGIINSLSNEIMKLRTCQQVLGLIF